MPWREIGLLRVVRHPALERADYGAYGDKYIVLKENDQMLHAGPCPKLTVGWDSNDRQTKKLIWLTIPEGTWIEVRENVAEDIYEVYLAGQWRELRTQLYAKAQPGEAPWETVDRLGLDEESLL